MKFYFCVTCGKRITEGDVAAGHGRDKKLKGVFCKECAVGVTTMDEMPLSEDKARQLLQNEKGGPSQASPSAIPAIKFYFCEKCGKRLDEQDLETGRARDKKLRGVYCTDCSDGVLTMEFAGMTTEEARRLVSSSKPANGRAPSALRRRRGATSGIAQLKAGARRSKSGTQLAPDGSQLPPPTGSRAPLWVGGIVGGITLLGLLFLMMGSGSGERKKPDRSKKTARSKKDSARKSLNAPPDKDGGGTERKASDSKAPSSTNIEQPTAKPSTTSSGDKETRAEAAFALLETKLKALSPTQKAEAIRLCEGFLAEFGDTIVAARVRGRLRELQGTGTSATAGVAVAKKSPEPVEPGEFPTRGLVGHWPLDEGKGNMAYDVSGKGLHAKVSSKSAWEKGRIHGGLLDQDPGPVIRINHRVTKENEPFTWAVWFKCSDRDFKNAHFMSRGRVPGAGTVGLHVIGGQLAGYVCAGGIQRANTPLRPKPGDWHHAVMTFDGSVLRVYANGKLGEERAIPTPLKPQSWGLVLGCYAWRVPYHFPFFGSLDDVRVYDRALDPGEVLALYQATDRLAAAEPPPIPKVPTAPGKAKGQPATAGITPSAETLTDGGKPFSPKVPLSEESKLLPGWILTYFDNPDLKPSAQAVSRLVQKFDYPTKNISDRFTSYAGVRMHNWSLQYTGLLKVQKTGIYAFEQVSSTQSHVGLWVGEREVFAGKAKGSLRAVHLQEGFHKVRIGVRYGKIDLNSNNLFAYRVRFAWGSKQRNRKNFDLGKMFMDPNVAEAVSLLTPPKGKKVYLKDLPAFGKGLTRQAFGPRPAGKIKVKKQPSPNGLWMAPPAKGQLEAMYYLDGKFSRFAGFVALNDSTRGSGSPVAFRILGDGKQLWASNAFQKPKAWISFNVSVRRIKRMKLIVMCLGDNSGADAVWVEPQLSR